MIDYRGPVEDIEYALQFGADAQRLDNWDPELCHEVVTQAARFIDSEIAPLDQIADQQGASISDGRVVLPESFVKAYNAYSENGWPGLLATEEEGGQEQPEVLGSVVSEMLSGACLGLQTILSLPQGAMRTIRMNGTEQQKSYYLPRLASGRWLATMCLTEPTAGSDLSQIKSKAVPDGGGWSITGTKIFITGGDQNLSENIVHLVLARTPEAPEGVRGLSLFICPAVTEDGRRNNVEVLRIEEKMGLHVSPTCQMNFDGAQAEMLGSPGEGLRRMFTMMNATRLDVGLEGLGVCEVAKQRSWSYARERLQGRSPGATDPVEPLYRHGDVQRMLLRQAALAQGSRALLYRTAVEMELPGQKPLVEFLTPVCKSFCTDAGFEAADLAVQIHGGYGFCKEYRVEQIVRDARITRIYEGTNGIQAMTLATRSLHVGNGACREAFENWVKEAKGEARDVGLDVSADSVSQIFAHWQSTADIVAQSQDPGMVASDFMRLTGLLAFGVAWLYLERGLEQSPEPAKLAALVQYVHTQVLPEAPTLASLVKAVSKTEPVDAALFAD